MNPLEAAVTASLYLLSTLAVFALLIGILTFGGPGLALFAAGVIVGWLLPHPRQ